MYPSSVCRFISFGSSDYSGTGEQWWCEGDRCGSVLDITGSVLIIPHSFALTLLCTHYSSVVIFPCLVNICFKGIYSLLVFSSNSAKLLSSILQEWNLLSSATQNTPCQFITLIPRVWSSSVRMYKFSQKI